MTCRAVFGAVWSFFTKKIDHRDHQIGLPQSARLPPSVHFFGSIKYPPGPHQVGAGISFRSVGVPRTPDPSQARAVWQMVPPLRPSTALGRPPRFTQPAQLSPPSSLRVLLRPRSENQEIRVGSMSCVVVIHKKGHGGARAGIARPLTTHLGGPLHAGTPAAPRGAFWIPNAEPASK